LGHRPRWGAKRYARHARLRFQDASGRRPLLSRDAKDQNIECKNDQEKSLCTPVHSCASLLDAFRMMTLMSLVLKPRASMFPLLRESEPGGPELMTTSPVPVSIKQQPGL
jgi:hypothetical protein